MLNLVHHTISPPRQSAHESADYRPNTAVLGEILCFFSMRGCCQIHKHCVITASSASSEHPANKRPQMTRWALWCGQAEFFVVRLLKCNYILQIGLTYVHINTYTQIYLCSLDVDGHTFIVIMLQLIFWWRHPSLVSSQIRSTDSELDNKKSATRSVEHSMHFMFRNFWTFSTLDAFLCVLFLLYIMCAC